MPSLDSLRDFLATAIVAIHLPVAIYLLVLHALTPLWRRVGMGAFAVLLALYFSCVWLVIDTHALWSWQALPWPWFVSALAVVPLALAIVILAYTYRSIEPRTLHLIRQIVPDENRRLITDGALGRWRHPRYTAFSLIAIAGALLTGYPLVIGAGILSILLFYAVIWFEERELLHYFGEEFLRYRRETPALWPRF